MKKITLFFVAMFFAMTTFASGFTSDGTTKFYLDFNAAANILKKWPATVVFTDGEIVSESVQLEKEDDNFYEIVVPNGTWTGVKVTFSDAIVELSFNGTNNCFVANRTPGRIYPAPMLYGDNDGTWTTYTPVVEEPENPEEPVGTVIAGGTKLYLDVYYMGALKNKLITVTFSDGTNTEVLNAVDTVDVKKFVFSVTAPAGNWTSVEYAINGYTLTLTEYDGVKTYFKVFDKFNVTKVGNDGDGVWLAYNGDNLPTLPSGTNIANQKVLYFAPNASLAESCDAYRVVFFDSYGLMCKTSALSKLSDGKYFFTNNVGTAVSFSIIAYKAGECVARFDNVTWDGAGTLFVVNEDATAGTWDATYVEPARVINAAWNIENNVEGFSGVQVTFSGIDPNGRLLGGDATSVDLISQFSSQVSFQKVELKEDGTEKLTPVSTLTGQKNGYLNFTRISDFTFELFLVPDIYELVDGKYMREGNYRITIKKSHIQIKPNPLNALTASQDFVFDFTIENDYVFPTLTDLDYSVFDIESEEVLESRLVSEISSAAILFDEEISLVNELPETPSQETWPYIHFGETSYPLNCEVVEDYILEFTIADENIEKFTEMGLYTITVPEGFIYSGDPAEKIINTEISFGLTIGEAMPANGVIYFDPAGRPAEDIAVNFVGADGSVKAANLMQIGEIYKIIMPAGKDWVSFSVEGLWDDPATSESNLVTLYYVSDLFYNGEYNMFTLNEDAPAEATTANGVWSVHTVTPIVGGTHFYYSIASSPYFAESPQFGWKVTFVDAEDNAEVVEMDSINPGIFEFVAPDGTWSMFYITLVYNGREFGSVYIEYDGERNMFTLAENANPYSLSGTMSVYDPNNNDGPSVNVENATLSNIMVQDGMIVADGEYQIFTITGQNVTAMNGNLHNGVYVVRTANATIKVIVK